MSNFLGDIGSFFSGGADEAAVKAGQLKADGYTKAGNEITAGENKALDYIKTGADTGDALYKPLYDVGTGSLTRLADLYGLNGVDATKAAVDQFTTSPGYQFRVDEGQKALERGAAAKGGLYSGAAGKALVRFGQGVATDEYGKYTAGLTNLAGFATPAAAGRANIATGAATSNANIATNAASGRAAALIGNGDALAAGEIGRANAVSGGINNALKLGGALIGMATGNPLAAVGTTSTGASGLGSFLSSSGSNPFNPDGSRNAAAYG